MRGAEPAGRAGDRPRCPPTPPPESPWSPKGQKRAQPLMRSHAQSRSPSSLFGSHSSGPPHLWVGHDGGRGEDDPSPRERRRSRRRCAVRREGRRGGRRVRHQDRDRSAERVPEQKAGEVRISVSVAMAMAAPRDTRAGRVGTRRSRATVQRAVGRCTTARERARHRRGLKCVVCLGGGEAAAHCGLDWSTCETKPAKSIT